MGVEKRRAAKRNREVAFALRVRQLERGKKEAGQVRVLKLIGISTKWAQSACLKRVKHGIGDLPASQLAASLRNLSVHLRPLDLIAPRYTVSTGKNHG
jgi:hypothetical protein